MSTKHNIKAESEPAANPDARQKSDYPPPLDARNKLNLRALKTDESVRNNTPKIPSIALNDHWPSQNEIDNSSFKISESSKEQFKTSVQSFSQLSKQFKVKQKNEKNFKDLNQSLANLASRRVQGRSASDNDAILLFSSETKSKNKQSQTAKNLLEDSPRVNVETPISSSKFPKNIHSSAKRGFDITPNLYYQGRKNGRYNLSTQEKIIKELGLSDIDYGKFQSVIRFDNNKLHMQSVASSKPIATEGDSPPQRYGDYEGKSLAEFFSQRVAYTEGADYEDEPENIIEEEDDSLHSRINHLNIYKHNNLKVQTNLRYHHKTTIDEESQDSPNYTPSFKDMTYLAKSNKKFTYPERFYTQPEESRRGQHSRGEYNLDIIPDDDNSEQLNQNAISDGVEYSMGGVGYHSGSKPKSLGNQSMFKKKGRFDSSISKGSRRSNRGDERFASIERQTLDSWKKDILNIRKDMEKRKQSMDEVNRFVCQIYGDDIPGYKSLREPIKEKNQDSIVEMAGHLSERPGSEHQATIVNFSRLRLDNSPSNTPALGSPSHTANKDKAYRKKISFEFRSTTEGNEDRSPLETKAGTVESRNNLRRTNYEFTTETVDGNMSFVYDGVSMEKGSKVANFESFVTEKPACCGSGSGRCTIF